MKSTQDLVILMNQVAAQIGRELISIEVFTNKSFRITGYRADSSELLYDSDTAVDQIDINDLPYYSANEIWAMIGAQATDNIPAPEQPKNDSSSPDFLEKKPVSFGGIEL